MPDMTPVYNREQIPRVVKKTINILPSLIDLTST